MLETPLTITSHQLKVFESAADLKLATQLAAHFRQEHEFKLPDWSDAELTSRLVRAIAKARGHGVQLPGPLAAFATLAILAGPDFDEHPAVAAQLNSGDLPIDTRVMLLTRSIPDEIWVSIRDSRTGEA